MRDPFSALGKGLVAGMIGTAAMTLSSTLEAKLRNREGSSAPAEAAEKVLGVEPVDDAAEARFSNLVHWAYGTLWGAARGALDVTGLPAVPASATHFAAVWGSALGTLPALRIAPPPWKWGAKEIAVDACHHAVYAAVTGLAYAALSRAWPTED